MRRRTGRLHVGTQVVALAVTVFLAATVTALWTSSAAVIADARNPRFHHNGATVPETPPSSAALPKPAEAQTGFDNKTNGYTDQSTFDLNMGTFGEVDGVAEGLGPTFNAQSCRECHQNVVVGGASQVAELRTGKTAQGQFYESLGGSLIQARATDPSIVEQVGLADDTRTFRISTNTLGAGYIEAIANATLQAIRDAQPRSLRGVALLVPVLEGDGSARIGRFGWKSQHGSLLSFSADAYLNEVGVTSPLLPDENTSNGRDVSASDPVADPEDGGTDIGRFADFMRATKAPSRGPITSDVQAGEQLFASLGCTTCHTASITTAPAGTVINAGAFTIPDALGNKVIHPYSDFLLHDIGSGDGIPVLDTPDYASTATQIRTAPLWGLRTRNRLMHDGQSFTVYDAIRRHTGQAAGVRNNFMALTSAQQQQLYAFLGSL